MTGSIFLEFGQLSVSETDDTVFIPVVRIGDLSGAVTIEYSITGDTATLGVDFIDNSGFISMDPDQDRVLVPVSIIDDNLSEDTETFALGLISVTSGTLLFPRTTLVDILDDENPATDPPANHSLGETALRRRTARPSAGADIAMDREVENSHKQKSSIIEDVYRMNVELHQHGAS